MVHRRIGRSRQFVYVVLRDVGFFAQLIDESIQAIYDRPMQICLTVSTCRRVGDPADHIVAVLYLRVRGRSRCAAEAVGKINKFCDD